ncbi:MAG: SPOR domain-containing protein [Bacteroidota bacterium]
MKLDILVPAILIVCLIALAWLLSEIFNSPEDLATVPAQQNEIVLDPSRYTDGSTATNTPANVSNTPDALSNGETTTGQSTSGSEGNSPNENDFTNNSEETGTSSSPSFERPAVAPATTDFISESERNAGSTATRSTGNKYLVIAGTFRQEANARQQVKRLKRAGFADAELGFTNRGAYAVALVGSSNSYRSASTLANQASSKGYQVFVKQRK